VQHHRLGVYNSTLNAYIRIARIPDLYSALNAIPQSNGKHQDDGYWDTDASPLARAMTDEKYHP
jgi:hypothetical protein